MARTAQAIKHSADDLVKKAEELLESVGQYDDPASDALLSVQIWVKARKLAEDLGDLADEIRKEEDGP